MDKPIFLLGASWVHPSDRTSLVLSLSRAPSQEEADNITLMFARIIEDCAGQMRANPEWSLPRVGLQ